MLPHVCAPATRRRPRGFWRLCDASNLYRTDRRVRFCMDARRIVRSILRPRARYRTKYEFRRRGWNPRYRSPSSGGGRPRPESAGGRRGSRSLRESENTQGHDRRSHGRSRYGSFAAGSNGRRSERDKRLEESDYRAQLSVIASRIAARAPASTPACAPSSSAFPNASGPSISRASVRSRSYSSRSGG